MPLLFILRDLMKISQNKKETKKILSSEKVRVNGKIVRDVNFPLTLFDTLTIENKNFRIKIKNNKFDFSEIKEFENNKIVKVIGKKILHGNKIQINLSDGRNILTKEKINVGDSTLINLTDNKIEKVFSLKTGAKAIVLSGKHISKEGKIESVDENRGLCLLDVGDKKINVKIDNLMVLS